MIETTKSFNKIDLINDYWQINIIEKNRHKIAFNTKRKKYKFCVISFELINAFAIFQIIMNDFLRFFLDRFVIVYLNDILIYNKNDEKHLKHVILIVKTLHKKKYYAKSLKCFFFSKIYWILWSYHWRRENSYEWKQIENNQKLIVVADDSWCSIIFKFLFLLLSFHRKFRYNLRFLVRFNKKNRKSQIQICDNDFYDSKCFRINQEHYVFRQNFCSIRYFFIFHHRNKCLEFWMKNNILSSKIKRHWTFDCFWKQNVFICWTKLFYSWTRTSRH